MLYCLFCFILFFAIVSIRLPHKKSVHILLPIIFVCYVLSFIRWESGTDWDIYVSIFHYSEKIDNNYTNVEEGFFLLNHFSHFISNSYSVALFLQASIIFPSVFYVLKKQPLPLVSFFLFFSSTLGYIFFIRQSISVSLVLLSYVFIVKQDKKRFFTCIIVACLFHITSLVALPLYAIYHSNVKWKYVLVLLIVISILSIISTGQWMRTVAAVHPYIEYKINSYIELTETGKNTYITMSPQRAILNHLIKRSFIAILLILYCKGRILNNGKLNGYLKIYCYSTIIYLIVTPVSMDLSRMCTSIEIVDILLFPLVLNLIRKPANQYIALFIIIILGFSKFASNLGRFPEIFNNYNSIFSI